MAVVYDPHQKEPGNKIRGKAVSVLGTNYRMLVPPDGPFYSHSLVVKSGSTTLRIAEDYLITHPYMTGMQRTGRASHGMIWITNPKYVTGFTLDYDALGIGSATTAQVNAERTANAGKFPTDCQWEEVIGDVYFPPVDIQFDWANWKGERELMQAIADIGTKLTTLPPDSDGSMVLSLLKHYHAIVEALYRNSPAIPHVTQTNNPHLDASWGRMRTIELNGIASDTSLVAGRNQATLADYVNQRSAKASDFADKMLRAGATRIITGTFTMLPGLSSVTSSKDDEASGVGTSLQVDDKVVRLIAKDSSTVNAGNNPITFKGGANALVLYPDSRGLQWNGKKLLDPTTVGPYLPGNEGGGDGVFFAINSGSVTITGNGIQTVPFICTWVPPDDTSPDTLALRMLTNDFGTSESLAATPALITKLATAFTGKLESAKAYINGMQLLSSITIDALSFNLGNVSNILDSDLPVSTAQATEFAKYAVLGHTHTADVFGIGNATTAKAGLIKFGGLVNDATLALDGSYALTQTTAVEKLEEDANGSDASAVVDIIRYGLPGNAEIADQGTAVGWMVTVKANNYFVRKDYTAALATFNLLSLFPDTHADTTLGVYVDLINEVATYVVKDNADFADNETLTKIGEIITTDDGVDSITIHNTTRLGEFRELVEHEANVNAHTPRTMTEAQFGYMFGRGGPAFANGALGARRFDGDWRAYSGNAWTRMDNVDWDTDSLIFSATGTTKAYLSLLIHQTPYLSLSPTVMDIASTVNNAASVVEVVLGMYTDRKGARNRFSLLINQTNNITDSSGSLCYVGFAVNYGTTRQILIGLTSTAFITSVGWTAMAPKVTFSATRDGSGKLTMNATVAIAGYSVDIVLALNGTPILSVTRPDTGATQVVTLDDRFATAGVDISDVGVNATWPLYHGVGGMFGAETAVKLTYNLATYKSLPRYETAFDVMSNLSEMSRVRTLRKSPTPAGVTGSYSGIVSDAVTDDATSGSLLPEGKVGYMNSRRLLAYSSDTEYTVVVVRD